MSEVHMKLLIYDWNSYLQHDVKYICNINHIEVVYFKWTFTNKSVDESFVSWFLKAYRYHDFDALFSVNYWPLLSVVAQKLNLRYIAWCYDNPLNVVNIEETLDNSVNSVFFFDKIQASKYQNMGFETVHYLPLCVNTKRLSMLQISSSDRHRFSSDVSFVGSLYESRYREIYSLLDDYSKGYLDSNMALQKEIYGFYLFEHTITDEFIHNINKHISTTYTNSTFILSKEALTFAMASEATRNDRLILLSLLGKRFYTKLYSYQTNAILNNVVCCPAVDYVTEMPKVFACSKINLNPILRCIQSGIPLRALDIMGAGGFLLSSYQPELAEYFSNENEMVMYDSIPDAIEKTAFFIKNDLLREKIALNGRAKVTTHFSLDLRWKEILELSKLI